MVNPTDFDSSFPDNAADFLRRLLAASVSIVLCAAMIARHDLPADSKRSAPPAALAALPDVADDAQVPERLETFDVAAERVRHPAFPAPLRSAQLGSFDELSVAAASRRMAPPPALLAARAAPGPLDAERFVVVIDPGHGGTDPGSRAPNGLFEKDLTIDIARRAQLFLSEFGDIEIVLTRDGDEGLSRADRVARIRQSEADVFVSLHFNHLPQTDVTLVESYYAGSENIAESQALQAARASQAAALRPAGLNTNGGADTGALRKVAHFEADSRPDTRFTEGSARIAQLVQKNVHDEVRRDNPSASNAGVKRDTLFVLTRSFVAGTLVELTCISNPDEADRLAGDSYRDGLAAALADAIRDYKRSLDTRPLGELGA